MDFFPRTRDNHTGSYLERRRRKRMALAFIALATIAVGTAIALGLGSASPRSASPRSVAKRLVLADWTGKKWDQVLSACSASLSAAPLDAFYLTFKGFASFYKSVELPDGEDRTALLGDSVISLRKALLVDGSQRAPTEYVLGKAYFLLGHAYFDESVKYIEASVAHGYVASDSREYLALAYAGLGEKAKAVKNFETALSGGRGELLLMAAAKAYMDAGDPSKSELLLIEAISSGKDDLVRERCRFLLADIYRTRGDSAKVEEQLNLVIQKDPDSAEAHYRLGLLLQERGDTVRARAEWRKAVAIDPMHAAARQKLTEKL
jgi:tetratricopeptide (TPR) repeat protein